MKPYIALFSILFPFIVNAQESKPSYFAAKQRFEIGLNITNTISSFVGSSNNNSSNDPYLLSIRYGGATKRLRIGLNFLLRDKTTPNFTGSISEKEQTFKIRAGYEQVIPVSRKMGFYWGADLIAESGQTHITNLNDFGTSTLTETLKGFGAGPVLGFVWRVHPRVALTTESSLYGIYQIKKQALNAPPDVSNKKSTDFIFQPLIPSSLYVNFIF